MKKIVIIPLKSDSNRFPDKNFACINGKPLLINTINKLNESGINTIVISTDVPKRVYSILKAENTYHYTFDEICILDRPIDLMGDTKTEHVIANVIKNISINEDYIIVLTQVTSPLWNPVKLTQAFHKLELTDIDSVVSTSPDYKPDGCFYVFTKSTFLQNNKKIYTSNTFLITMPWEESVDIDFEHELSISNALMRGNYV